MSKVYIVTSGVYSSYHICRCFLDKEKAETYLKLREDYGDSYEEPQIEEYELDDNTEFKPFQYIDVRYYVFKGKETRIDYRLNLIKTNDVDFNNTDIEQGSLNSVEELYNRTEYYESAYNYGLEDYDGITKTISISRPVYLENLDEDYLEVKYKKICQDLLMEITSLIEIEGWDNEMIKDWLNNKQKIIPESE